MLGWADINRAMSPAAWNHWVGRANHLAGLIEGAYRSQYQRGDYAVSGDSPALRKLYADYFFAAQLLGLACPGHLDDTREKAQRKAGILWRKLGAQVGDSPGRDGAGEDVTETVIRYGLAETQVWLLEGKERT